MDGCMEECNPELGHATMVYSHIWEDFDSIDKIRRDELEGILSELKWHWK